MPAAGTAEIAGVAAGAMTKAWIHVVVAAGVGETTGTAGANLLLTAEAVELAEVAPTAGDDHGVLSARLWVNLRPIISKVHCSLYLDKAHFIFLAICITDLGLADQWEQQSSRDENLSMARHAVNNK